jgi:16S rRNA (guanine(1405)-N(7))-methyltransferase
MTEANERLVDAVVANRKYRTASRDLIAAVLEQERRGAADEAELVKATRNKLHQVVCAYQEGTPRYERWLGDLAAAHQTGDRQIFVEQCVAIMRHHASTRERLPILRELYAATTPDWSGIRTIVDVGCGLNPLAIPLLDLSPEMEYHAYDVLGDLVEFLNAAFPLLGVRGRAEVCDVVHRPECLKKGADLALLLKVLPCLEQIEKGAGERLLGAVDADRILVSFPVHSLGGARKGMGRTYETWLREAIRPRGFAVKSFDFRTELAFVLSRQVAV